MWTQSSSTDGKPDIVTARSVEFGSVSPATCIDTPVVCGREQGDKGFC